MIKPPDSTAPNSLIDLIDGMGLVIFDFDGVIADSETISLATLRSALGAYGIAMTDAAVRKRFLGTSLKTIEEHVTLSRGTAEGFAKTWQSDLFDRLRKELLPVPFVTKMLDRLAEAGVPYCIASSSSTERIQIALDAMTLAHRFEFVFSAEDVRRGKPAPDLFLLAAGTVGIDPKRCLVVEDSPMGVQAAKSAGMRCAGFVGGLHLRDIAEEHAQTLRETGAEVILTSFEA